MTVTKLACLALAALLIAVPAVAQDAKPIQLKSMNQNVTYNTGGADMIVPTGGDVNLEQKFTIKTDPTGKALLTFQDEAKIMLKENTDAQVSPGAIAIKSGESWMHFTKRGSQFKIKTPSAVLGIRGTSFQVKVGIGGDTSVHLVEGEVGITTDKGETILKTGETCTVSAKTKHAEVAPLEKEILEEYKNEGGLLELDLQEGGGDSTLLNDKLKQESGKTVDIQKVKELEGVYKELQKDDAGK